MTTHVTALGQGENAAAGVRNDGVLGGKLRSLSAEVAQLGALTVEDENGVTKINGGRIDTDSLFAQNITATGTITGAQLIGAILSGDAIDIQAETGNCLLYTSRQPELHRGTGHPVGQLSDAQPAEAGGSGGAGERGTLPELSLIHIYGHLSGEAVCPVWEDH